MGGKCERCEATDGLEFDHVDPEDKELDVSKVMTYPEASIRAEFDKCQLLCRRCHQVKSILDAGKTPAVGTHGTLSSYRYCRCDACRSAKAAYMKEYMRTHVRKRDRKPG
jgi:hypothetical protein